MAREYLASAAILRNNQKCDVAVYLCGYATEIALKNRICRTLGWLSFPDTRREFEELSSYKTHNLEILLHLSGAEHRVKPALNGDCSIVTKWNPEQRYNPRGTKTLIDANDMITATEKVLKVIL
jgi:hypothetical protein